MRLILASNSASRKAMLGNAGVPFIAEASGADEDAAKAALAEVGTSPRDTTDALAELKALKVSMRHPADLVLGSDSIVVLDDGTLLDKPETHEDAERHLRAMSGGTHRLISAAVIAEGGRPVWRHVDIAKLQVRALSDGFIRTYLDAEWPAIAGCVGCFRIEGPGVQLFARTEGSHFTILGMPLIPVLDFLRVRGILAS
jgi:septum formation protein